MSTPRLPLRRNIIRGQSTHNTFGMVRRADTDGDGDLDPKPHQGWDFEAAPGTPFFAVADGVVESVVNRGDYGLQLVLKLDVPVAGAGFAFYAHLETTQVAVGARVTQGQQLGTTGRSGNAARLPAHEDHLHFEARTIAHPGFGLGGRISPLAWFGVCPLHEPSSA